MINYPYQAMREDRVAVTVNYTESGTQRFEDSTGDACEPLMFRDRLETEL